MLAPALIVLFAINVVPISDTFLTSLNDFYLPEPRNEHFVGFQNYVNLFQDLRFTQSFSRTVAFMFMVVTFETILGFAIALYLSAEIKGGRFLRGVFLLPIILTPIATAFMWRIMYSPTLGVLNYILSLAKIPAQTWIYSVEQALPSVALVVAWCKTPFMIMVFYTGLLALPDGVLEAATIDGASYLQQLWRIKLPLIRPVFFVAILFQTVDSAKEFDFTFILTRGGPGSATETLSVYTYLNAFGFLKMGYGSASAVLMSLFIAMLAVLIIRFAGINLDR